jgi:FtsP/CotA-like multicopper oxidase with cupredoxin domain
MDGVPAISQPEVEPGRRFIYEFTRHQHGTLFYHSQGAMQEMIGMLGLFIIHPRKPYRPRVDKDFGTVLQEWWSCRTTRSRTRSRWSSTG